VFEEFLHRVLPVLRRVADVFMPRRRQVRKARAQSGHDLCRVIHRERRLRDEGEPLRIAHGERRDIGDALHQMNRSAEGGIEAPHRPLNLGMARMADEDDVAAFICVALHFHVHFGHERTGGIKHREAALCGRIDDRARHAVRREDHVGAGGNLIEFLDEDRSQPRRRSTTWRLCTTS
jgi:hypothetical protein